jgi:hypothetical protein
VKIDDRAEEIARKLFGFAIRAELDDFERSIADAKPEILSEARRLSVAVADGVVLVVTEGQQPSDADLRKIAETAASVEKRYELSKDEVHAFLSKVVFGGQALDDVFSTGDAVTVPFIVAGNLLGSYRNAEQDQGWWEFLDEVEAAIEAAPDPA